MAGPQVKQPVADVYRIPNYTFIYFGRVVSMYHSMIVATPF